VTVNDPAGPNLSEDTGYVCLYVAWNYGPSGRPADQLTPPLPFLEPFHDRMSFGPIYSAEVPTAVYLPLISHNLP
jgi:hypothetical protein